jgi:hypothetical protein
LAGSYAGSPTVNGKPTLGWSPDAVDHDPSLIDVLDLRPGRSAVRTGVGKPWTGRR